MIREVKKTDYPILVDIWESAVLSTHDFLKKEDCMDMNKTVVWSDL